MKSDGWKPADAGKASSGSVPAHAPRTAPGKVTRTSKLPVGPGRSVQRKTQPSQGTGSARNARSAWEQTMDPWMDAAHRGLAALTEHGAAPVQAHGQQESRDPTSVHRAAADGLRQGGQALPYVDAIQDSFGPAHDIGDVRAHIGGSAEEASERMGAEAYATGQDIVFRSQPDLHTVAHEAAHVIQQRAGVSLDGGVGRAGDQYERHADAVADLVVQGQSAEQELARLAPVAAPPARGQGVQASAVQMDPVKGALTVSKRLMKWLGRESVKKQISKHVAKHGRQIAGKGVHTIFKNPNQIRQMARKAGQQAMELAAANTRKAADEVLSGPGIRMFRQAAGAGKFRWVIESEFKNAIGKNGEKILKIIVDVSGRVVSAYPTGRFTALGLGVAAMQIFDAKAAEAGERIQDAVTTDAERTEARQDSWGDFIIDLMMPLGFGVSSLNEGEDLSLEIHRITSKLYGELIAEIEAEEKRALTDREKDELYELLASSVGGAMMSQEETEAEDEDEE